MPDLYPNRAARRAALRGSRRRRAAGVVTALGVGAASGVMLAPPAGADTYQVTNLGASGAGSLAQAILDANSHPGPDTIVFAPGLTGLIGNPQLTITDAVTIEGPGAARVTLDGAGTNRILNITAAAGTVSISRLTFAHGAGGTGGAIRSEADLTLSGTVFAANLAGDGGAISMRRGPGEDRGTGGTLTVLASRFSGNTATNDGGAIDALGGPSVTIEGSTFEGNKAGRSGGAISTYTGDVTIADTTISGNTAAESGGAIKSYGYAFAAADPAGPTVALRNVTITGNAAPRGAAIDVYFTAFDRPDAQLTISADHATIVGNTGGADAIATAGDGITNIKLSNTVIYSPGSDGVPAGTQQVYSRIGGTDPMLGALADNGGLTKTMLPQPGSPLIDAGDPAYSTSPGAAATDQRGTLFPRVSGGRTDIGAVEVQVPVVTVTSDPAPQSVTAGQSATFTASCSVTDGASLSYEWQVSTDGGQTFTPVATNTTGSYTIASTTVEQSGSQYRAVCSDPRATSATTSAATLTVTAPVPVITVTANPSPVAVAVGQPATFTAACAATEGANVAYQWQVSADGGQTFNPIAGATSATYTIAATTSSQSGYQYRAVCSAPGAQSATTSAADLAFTVTAPASPYAITIQSPAAGAAVKPGALVPVQFGVTGPKGQKLTTLQGLALTLTCSARVSIAGQAPSCGIYNPLTGNFTALVKAPTTLPNGAAAPITATIVTGGRTMATATSTVTIRR